MKKRVIALSVASIMSAQSIAFAQAADRTAGIGEQATVQAQANIAKIHADLLKLDQSLDQVAKAIETRDQQGNVLNGAAVVGAAAGLGLSAIAYFATNSRHGEGGGGIVGLFIGVAGMGSSLLSSGSGVLSLLRKDKASADAVEAKINEIKGQVSVELAQSNDKMTKGLLTELNTKLDGLQASLISYQQDESATKRDLVIAQISQAMGTAMLMYGMTQKQSKMVSVGALIMTAGNIASVIKGMSDSQADQILKEIELTQKSLRTAAAALN
ncbi:MAG: hypothetical protein HUU57_11925 [Bdellovibrio sp.]|nr:hypothetical protein [Bdellovibrio sp.]